MTGWKPIPRKGDVRNVDFTSPSEIITHPAVFDHPQRWCTSMDFVAIDFETANPSRNSACAIGITPVKNGIVGESYYSLIRPPELEFSPWNTRVHGITEIDVIDSPTLRDLWPEISPLIEDGLVVAHNASFDMSVLRHSLHAVGLFVPRLSYLCSCILSRQLWPNLASHSLGFLSVAHSIPLDHHHAGSDSLAAAQLVLLGGKEKGVACLRELARCCHVSVGEVYSNDSWTPVSGPSSRRSKTTFELQLPDGYEVSTHEFFGKQVMFTGTMIALTRDEAKQVVKQLGGDTKSSVTKNTDYLVVGELDVRRLAEGASESEKLRDATSLREKGGKVKIITDSDFMEMISTFEEDSGKR